MEHDEKRKYRRFPIGNLEGTLFYSQRVSVVNMSIDGMLVESTTALKAGTVYRIQIEHEETKLELTAKVRRCYVKSTRPLPGGETQTVFESGLNFDGILTDKAPSIVDLIERNLMVDLERRIFERFQIRLEDPVQLSNPCEFVVSSLSMSGMKIRTTVVPSIGTTYELGIRMPGDEVIQIRGKVAFVDPINAPLDRYIAEVGIQFVHLAAADRKTLVNLINDHSGNHETPVDEPFH